MAYKIVIDKIAHDRGKDIAYVHLIDDVTSELVGTADIEYTGDEAAFTAAIKDRFKKRLDEIRAQESTRASAQAIADRINILE
jgi:hypothetical protein